MTRKFNPPAVNVSVFGRAAIQARLSPDMRALAKAYQPLASVSHSVPGSKAAGAIRGGRRELFFAVAGNDVAAPLADGGSGFLGLGAVGDDIAGADRLRRRNAELAGPLAHGSQRPQVGIRATEDEQG